MAEFNVIKRNDGFEYVNVNGVICHVHKDFRTPENPNGRAITYKGFTYEVKKSFYGNSDVVVYIPNKELIRTQE
jgi:hypothetical protein